MAQIVIRYRNYFSGFILNETSLKIIPVEHLTMNASCIYTPSILLLGVFICTCCCHSVMSDSLQLHGLQHARLPHPSPSLGTWSNSCPLSWWCHPTISSSFVSSSSCLPWSFPASGSFPVSQLFPSGGQSITASASASCTSHTHIWLPANWLVFEMFFLLKIKIELIKDKVQYI